MALPNSKPNPSVSYDLHAPVHVLLKPSYSCTAAALSDVALHKLVVVGDSIFTDVVLAHRLAHSCTLTAHIAARLRLTPAQPGSIVSSADTVPSASIGGGECARALLAMRGAEKWPCARSQWWVQGARKRGDVRVFDERSDKCVKTGLTVV